MGVSLKELESYLHDIYRWHEYQDYGPNGLQVEGKEKIKRILFAVSATAASVEEALKFKADCIICHHGLIWKGSQAHLFKGKMRDRLFPLIKNEISLFGIHLPMDGHPEIGHGAVMAKKLGMSQIEPFGNHQGMPTGAKGVFEKEIKVSKLIEKMEHITGHPIIYNALDSNAMIKTLGIQSGGASGHWRDATYQHLDAYLTGEISEYDWHESAEMGVHMFAAGHNATEEFGIEELMQKMSQDFKGKLELSFYSSPNPA